MQALYEDFLMTGGDWKKGVIWREVIQKRTGKSRGVRKWLTRAQLITYFGDEGVADGIIQRKNDTADLHDEIRDHPELPGLDSQSNICTCIHNKKNIYIYCFSIWVLLLFPPFFIACARTSTVLGVDRGRAGRRRGDDHHRHV